MDIKVSFVIISCNVGVRIVILIVTLLHSILFMGFTWVSECLDVI